MSAPSTSSSYAPTSGGLSGIPKGRARACTACRQVKLRCDAREKAPSPCTRCETQGLECKMDPTFKRVPARRQLEEVSNRLNHLQRSLGLDQTPGAATLEDYMRRSHRPDVKQLPFPATYTSSISDASSPMDDTSNFAGPVHFYALENETEQGTWTLGDVTLDASQVRSLFKHFDDTHYKHGPFLEPCTSLHAYYESSKLLFWTICMIGCFVFNEYDPLYYKILPHHRQLLSSKMMGDRVTLKTVHAMMCMATWTYPVSTQYDDLTWMLCGAAIHMGMIMGLHKPGHVHEYNQLNHRDPGSTYTRNVTWLSIFIISTGISSWLGMPPPLGAASHIETITSLCKDSSIPKWFRARAEIHRQTVQLVNSVDSKLDFRTRHSLIKIYEQELDRVKDMFEDVWNDDLEMEWQGARLYLYGIAFVSPSPTMISVHYTESPAVQAREVLLKGLAAAVACLDTVVHFKVPATAPGENRSNVPDDTYQLGFYPKHFFRIGAFANFYLLWFLAVDTAASEADKEVAKSYITFTYQFLCSFTHSPEHYRAGKAIEALAMMPISAGRPSNLKVSSRLGASFMYSFSLDGDSASGESSSQKTLPPMFGVDTVGDSPAHPKVVQAEAQTSPSAMSQTSTQTSPQSQPSQQLPQQQRILQAHPSQTPVHTYTSPQHQHPPPNQQHQQPLQPQNPHHVQQAVQPNSAHMPTSFPTSNVSQAPPTDQMFTNSQMFDPAMLAAMPNPNWEYPWGEWDSSVFHNLQMDPNMGPFNMEQMNLNERSYT